RTDIQTDTPMRSSWNVFPNTALSRPCRLGNGGGTQSDGIGGRGMRGRRDTGLVYVKRRVSTREQRAKPGRLIRGRAPICEPKGRFNALVPGNSGDGFGRLLFCDEWL